MAAALAGCGETQNAAACVPVGPGDGDAAPAILEVVEITEDGHFRTLTDGGTVHLQRPLQGGHVIYVGARVTGLCTDAVMITGRIRDAATNRVVAKETRRGFGLVDQGDGTALPDEGALGDVANIALCPELTGVGDVRGAEFLLEVELADAEGRTAQASLHVTPVCEQAAGSPERTTCECECASGAQAGGCG